MQALQQLIDTNQPLECIQIESPLNTTILQATPFNQAFQIVSDEINKLLESKNYTQINIHYGAKKKNDDNQEIRVVQQKEMLQEKIQLMKLSIKELESAEREEDLEFIESKWKEKMNKPQSNQHQIKQFMPVIFVEAKRKKTLYGSIFQEIDGKGMGVIQGKIGYRSPFKIFDKLEFSLTTSGRSIQRHYNQYQLNYSAPTYNSQNLQSYVGLSFSSSPLFKGIDQEDKTLQMGMTNNSSMVSLEVGRRRPKIFEGLSRALEEEFYLPSTKVSLRYSKIFKDTINMGGDITTGQYKSLKSEITLPFGSDVQFIKQSFSWRKYFDLFSWSKIFNNKIIKDFVQNSNLEWNLSLKTILSRRSVVSDLMEKIDVAGFENTRQYSNDYVQAKFGFKLNNYNYPFLGSIGVVPFLYAQSGISWRRNGSWFGLGSSGFGISYALNKMLSLQLIYSAIRVQNVASRQPVPFQIRLSVNE